ncbi:MAG: EAL domain-containing protein, partial [Sulfurimonas sp.]|nr:EAL domain-containing protein [Sulfurimonas sp.]
ILLLPYIFIIYNQNSEMHTLISLLIFIFLIILILFSRRYNKDIVNLIISKLTVERTEKELQHSQNNFSTIFQEATVGVFTYDTNLIIQESNSAFSTMLKAPLHKLINLDMKQLPDQNIRKCLNSILKGKKGFYEGLYHTKISNEDVWVSMETVPMYDTDEKINGGLGIVTDITHRVKSEEKIRQQTLHDDLTGLDNRLAFNNKLQIQLSKLSEQNNFGTLLFIDLDHFKTVNDSLGHHIGDTILKIFSSKASSILRENDTIARLGGDEFVILLDDLNRTEKSAIDTSYRVADKLHEVMKKPIEINEHTLHITLSIGIDIIDSQQKNIHDILKYADIAMYKAKDCGRNTTCFYKKEMSDQINEKLKLNNELRKALELNQFELYYQPIVELQSGKITSCEALIRWNHPERGLVFPDDFIPYAEESDLIISIGDWVIDAACKEFHNCHSTMQDIAVNISSRQFIQEDFVEKILKATKINNIHPSSLKLELTESVAIDNLSTTVKKMNLIKSYGFKIAMDDFGTGYSSLSYLKNLPFDYIKIDRSFVKDMLKNEDDASLIKTILTISKQFKFAVIAEGVETIEDIEFLKTLECDYIQGYVISKPIPADKFKELFRP